ncbi:adenosine deaminase family protein [candidate division KSB1 bacterium]|nr:adenosine deaminase family protein [candidate division KSB1 bacterium]NIR70468.1 adenosine deaminase family protein [candidate division KSB1 bacterium]NIS23198.1 adenosine deaminase family protein [candidate division KSB1 bacterium]NIT70058.1 adenosine deaminase family protein [candidate division KSB1 bacterium]NIU23695.1 adenosine deaminase family protein [candidate division KSB1 bacterium]
MEGKIQDLRDDELIELIHKIPKSELHVHLDGSLRLQTLIDLAKKESVKLPSYTVEGLHELVFKDKYQNLEEYLRTFGYTCAVMQRPEHLERISYELAIDHQHEGVRYVEVRFAPQLHINKQMDMATVVSSVNKGLLKAQNEFNQRKEVANGSEPRFYYGIIFCALRSFGPYSEYYSNFIDALSYSDMKTICSLSSLELAKGAVHIRQELGLPIVGFDLAGAEKGNPAKDHWRAFQYAHGNFLAKTVHAGEAYGPPSIFQAITELHADRIGHGYYLFDTSKVNGKIKDKEYYVQELCQYIADRRVTIEVCLTSNLQTNPTLKKIEDHSFKQMLEYELSTSICTDNRTVSKTTVTNELMLALRSFKMNPKQLKNTIVYGFKRSFFPDKYSKKRQYVRQCIDYYEKLVKGTPLEV